MTVTPHRVLAFDYLGEILLIYEIDLAVEVTRKSIHVVHPIHRSVTQAELAEIRSSRQPWPRTEFTCVYTYLPQAAEPHKLSVHSNFARSTDPAVILSEAPGMIELQLSEALRARMISHAANVCGIP